MYIQGWAFKENEKELGQENYKRFKEISHMYDEITLNKSPQYGHTKFYGQLLTEEAKQLNEKDIALLADHGNLCFGGECTISGSQFTGRYNTD